MALVDTGVALIVVAPDNRVLMIQEEETNLAHGKIAGQWSMPMETSHAGEHDMAALQRLLAEEVTGMIVAIEVSPYGDYEVMPRVWVRLYVGYTRSYFLPPAGARTDGVRGHCWLSFAEATGLWLRRGASEMLRDYQEGRRGSVWHTRHAITPLADQFFSPAPYHREA